ncbi:MAG TPA: amidohydrolase family protein [Burkholderiales bacterium]|nr:amidohydrolase family protein [Burkholderiales bacterium]
MSEPKPSYHHNPTEPKLKLPPGSCDAHFHVFGPKAKFPYDEKAPYRPADAPKDVLIDRHMFLGIERGVVVQSAAHGFDNSAAADLLADKKGSYVGVALAPVNVDMSKLKQLHEQGFRGVRFNYFQQLGSGPPIAEVMKLSAKLASLGWHLQLYLDCSVISNMATELKFSAVPVVIDHMGRVDASRGLDQTGFVNLLKLLEDKRFWVKVSGLERASRVGAPYNDAVPFARKLVAECGERSVWGSDWPHPNLDGIPDDGQLVDLIAEFADEKQRQALLVDNPMKLYKFTS